MARPSASPASNESSGTPIGRSVALLLHGDRLSVGAIAHGRLLHIASALIVRRRITVMAVLVVPVTRLHVHIPPRLIAIPYPLIVTVIRRPPAHYRRLRPVIMLPVKHLKPSKWLQNPRK
jgi:hypothetical protein